MASLKVSLRMGQNSACVISAALAHRADNFEALNLWCGQVEEEPDVNLPAAWRIDNFLDDYEDEKLDSLKAHKLEFVKVNAKSDAMAANFDDDYKVTSAETEYKQIIPAQMTHHHLHMSTYYSQLQGRLQNSCTALSRLKTLCWSERRNGIRRQGQKREEIESGLPVWRHQPTKDYAQSLEGLKS